MEVEQCIRLIEPRSSTQRWRSKRGYRLSKQEVQRDRRLLLVQELLAMTPCRGAPMGVELVAIYENFFSSLPPLEKILCAPLVPCNGTCGYVKSC